MRPVVWLAAILLLTTSVAAQAPQSADMWRGATASLGATAGPVPGTLRAGLQVLRTPDAEGLTGVLGGINGLGARDRFAPAPAR